MILGEVFQRFVSKSPISVMARGLMERAFNPQRLDEWFEATAESQYTRNLLFSSVFEIMSLVVWGLDHLGLQQADRARAQHRGGVGALCGRGSHPADRGTQGDVA
jgi:hypothetical protein